MDLVSEITSRLTPPFPDHAAFTGPPLDITGLTPSGLGQLWPLLQGTLFDAHPSAYAVAHAVLAQAEALGLAPELDEERLLATLQTREPGKVSPEWVLSQFACLVAPATPALREKLAQLVPPPEWECRDRFRLLALLHLADDVPALLQLRAFIRAELGDALSGQEFSLVDELGTAAILAMTERRYYWARESWMGLQADPALVLAEAPAYVLFSRQILAAAAARVDAIHAGTLPYVADAAFKPEDAQVLSRAVRVAALRDEPWLGDIVTRLLPKVCVAPTAAKTAPSQSLCVALGHAIEGVPTPESVAALRLALQHVRHAGLQKKLARNLKPAERALAQRPAVALRLAGAGIDTKQHRAMLATLFDASFACPVVLPWHEWRERLLGSGPAVGFARGLVWCATPPGGMPVSFMLDADDAPAGSDGAPLALADATPVALWHPVEAGPRERETWRARIVQRQLRQPLRQVYREYYLPGPEQAGSLDYAGFEGYQLAATPLIGLARREGWALGGDGLVRRFGALRVAFGVDARLYPGCGGSTQSARMVFTRAGERAALALRDVPVRIFSEACRAVDLLVGTTAVALDNGDTHERVSRIGELADLAHQAGVDAMRRHALETVLHAHIAAGTVVVAGRHVHAGGAKVHLRTGQVTRDGAAVALSLPAPSKKLAAVPWLPYDEAVLERVVHSVGALLEQGGTS